MGLVGKDWAIADAVASTQAAARIYFRTALAREPEVGQDCAQRFRLLREEFFRRV